MLNTPFRKQRSFFLVLGRNVFIGLLVPKKIYELLQRGVRIWLISEGDKHFIAYCFTLDAVNFYLMPQKLTRQMKTVLLSIIHIFASLNHQRYEIYMCPFQKKLCKYSVFWLTARLQK